MSRDMTNFPPCPPGMSEELYEQYVLWYQQPKRFETLYPVIYKEFLKPYIDLIEETKHEEN